MITITIVSKADFERNLKLKGISDHTLHLCKDFAFISICDTRGTPEVPYFTRQHNNALTVFCDDVEEDLEHEKYGKIEAFNYGQAKQIIHFVKANVDKTHWIIHCSAGISRSGAVGTFVNDYFRANYDQFKKRNPRIMPNGHILAMLNKVVREDED